ncbi:EamA family transporter RarD [Lysobacter capsici]|uniref:EamA family transporter RarD n=1 Tax=Lysobacter capsici TaxID=435897 RepID=UPI00287B9B20|nr:EamA family transporter RarD [Lysobacter capsici]WND79816.1 EamA family transporter RarD [Lysobacter capsici]WND85012.1 EamA family transporter RarD [Lysobacter capsici]
MSAPTDRRGLWIAVASFVLWGLMPLYWHLLNAVPSLQIVAHRIVWSTLLVTAWLCWKFGRHWLRDILREPRKAAMLALSGVLIAFNWGLYIWAVNAGHVIETSLGYFIGPLVSVMLGVLFLGERLRAVQWLAIALAFAGVLWLTFQYGRPPLIALGLAVSFAVYGLVRKLVAVEAVTGLGVENVYLFAPALALMLWGETHGQGGFAGGWGWGTDVLLVIAGALTALPLIGFAYAVRRVSLTAIGLLQYVAPTLQFLIGVLILREPFNAERAIGFVIIWIGLAVFASEGLLRSRRMAAAAQTA